MPEKEQEFKYHERLNIAVLSISKIKRLIISDIKDTLHCWKEGIDVLKQCFRIVGPAGVGKTEICYQIAEEISNEIGKPFDVIMVKAPVLSRDDFIIPFPVAKEDEISFKMLYSDFVPKKKDSYGLFVIDEFSRGDHPLQQLLWQVQNEYAVHRFQFPKGWFVISIDNPDDSEYSMDNLEDAAGLRRQLHLYTEVSPKDFLDYAIAQKFHPLVIEYIQTHPERIYDFDSQKQGAVYANPASYEKLSDMIIKAEKRSGSINFEFLEPKISGLLNTHMTRLFIEFARDKKDINPKDVFLNFDKVQKDIKKLKDDGDNNKLGELMVGFCTFLTTSMPEYNDKQLENIMKFLLIMPIDTGALFISQIDSFDRSSAEFNYMTTIHVDLSKKYPKYNKEFYEPIVKCGTGR